MLPQRYDDGGLVGVPCGRPERARVSAPLWLVDFMTWPEFKKHADEVYGREMKQYRSSCFVEFLPPPIYIRETVISVITMSCSAYWQHTTKRAQQQCWCGVERYLRTYMRWLELLKIGRPKTEAKELERSGKGHPREL